MEINVTVEKGIGRPPAVKWLRGIAEQVLVAEGASDDAEMGLLITGQEKIHELNRIYRGIDRPTDVLSFSMAEGETGDGFTAAPDGVLHLGEVIISYPQAVLQAKERDNPVRREVAMLIVHGVLHLLGYDHIKAAEGRKMRAREKAILEKLEPLD